MQYHHTGVVTDQKQPNEMYVEATKVWITNPDEHPCRIEYVRYEPDTPVEPSLQNRCHTAYTVDDLDQAISGKQVVIGPFDAFPRVRVVFIEENGALIEYIQFIEKSGIS